MLITEGDLIQEEEQEEHDRHWPQQYIEWQSPLAELWSALGKDVDPKALAQYTRVFKEIPAGLLVKMADRAVKDNGVYKNVPTIGACWESLRKVLGNPYDIDAAIETWIEKQWQQAVYKFQ